MSISATQSTDKLLEQPPWSALTTTHSAFALGNDLARRYPPDIAPTTGLREISDSALEALAALVPPGAIVGVFGPEPLTKSRAFSRHRSQVHPTNDL